MKTINFFDRQTWLADLKPALQVGEVVLVAGRTYRYGLEREGRDAVLTPVSVPLKKERSNV